TLACREGVRPISPEMATALIHVISSPLVEGEVVHAAAQALQSSGCEGLERLLNKWSSLPRQAQQACLQVLGNASRRGPAMIASSRSILEREAASPLSEVAATARATLEHLDSETPSNAVASTGPLSSELRGILDEAGRLREEDEASADRMQAKLAALP